MSDSTAIRLRKLQQRRTGMDRCNGCISPSPSRMTKKETCTTTGKNAYMTPFVRVKPANLAHTVSLLWIEFTFKTVIYTKRYQPAVHLNSFERAFSLSDQRCFSSRIKLEFWYEFWDLFCWKNEQTKSNDTMFQFSNLHISLFDRINIRSMFSRSIGSWFAHFLKFIQRSMRSSAWQ